MPYKLSVCCSKYAATNLSMNTKSIRPADNFCKLASSLIASCFFKNGKKIIGLKIFAYKTQAGKTMGGMFKTNQDSFI